MRVLVTGTDGYIGALLGPYLRERGHQVTGLDTGFYRDGWLYPTEPSSMTTLRKDVREVEAADLEGHDAVIHLAELSNDPLGEHDPALTYDINYQGSVRLAELSKRAGVRRFVYSSSCSVYGAGSDDVKTEESAPNPQTAYARCKVLVERDVAALADDTFAPVCLRNATAFGPSPRMRFDVVLNNLAGLAWITREIRMISDGTPWRPLVHVLDICQAMAEALEAPAEAVRGEVFNVGDSRLNYRVREIAAIVGEAFPGCAVTFGELGGDTRSYRVSFEKIRAHLPNFRCRYDAAAGARQLFALFSEISMSRQTFEAPPYTRLKALTRLIEEGRVDARLFWRGGAA